MAAPMSEGKPIDGSDGPRPYGFWDGLRSSPTVTLTPLVKPLIEGFSGGRNLYRAIDPDYGVPSPGVILAHVPTFFRWTALNQIDFTVRDASNHGYDGAAGVLLAMFHFNNGIGAVSDDLQGINEWCPIRFTTENFDTMSYDLVATIYNLYTIVEEPYGGGNSSSTQMCALIGATTSPITTTIASQASVFDIPQISPSATSAELNNMFNFPSFSRTIASDTSTAQRLASYLHSKIGVTHLGMLFVTDDFGTSFHEQMRIASAMRGITFLGVPIPVNTTPKEVKAALTYLKDTQFNYFIGVFYPSHYEEIMGTAYNIGLAGPGKLWIFTSALGSLVDHSTSRFLFNTTSPAAKATAGNAIFQDEGGFPGIPQYDRFLKEWRRISSDAEAWEYINSRVADQSLSSIFHNGTFDFNRTRDYFMENPSYVASFAYDAVVGLGISACKQQQNVGVNANATFSGSDHFEQFISETFLGATGRVSFGADNSNSRDGNTTYFVISNLRENRHKDGTSSFRSDPVSFLDAETQEWTQFRNRSFIFAGNETLRPPTIPAPEVQYFNGATRGICLALSAVGMALSIFYLIFTAVKRKHAIIQASQPPFLILICVGCLLMVASIIPWSMDESVASTRGCEIACMSRFWLVFIGFCLAVSALFSKLWRINRVMKNAKGFKKVAVTPVDVIAPLLILLSANLVVLIVWTVVSPFTYENDVISEDDYGRPDLVIGRCHSHHQNVFISVLLAIDGIAIIITLWQAYVARNISTDLSESKFIGFAVVFIFEVIFIGVPVAFIVKDQPTAVLLIASCIIFISSMSILLFIFFPKGLAMRRGEGLQRTGAQQVERSRGARAFRMDAGDLVLQLRNEIEVLEQEISDLKAKAVPEASVGAETVKASIES